MGGGGGGGGGVGGKIKQLVYIAPTCKLVNFKKWIIVTRLCPLIGGILRDRLWLTDRQYLDYM